MQNTLASMEQKKSVLSKKCVMARNMPDMHKNLFADQYFKGLKGKFEEILDNGT